MAGPGDDTTQVRLLGLPLGLHTEMQEHHGSLIRELQLVAVGMSGRDQGNQTARLLLDLVAAGREELSDSDGLVVALGEAHQAEGRPGGAERTVDVTARMTPTMLRHLEQEFGIFEQLESMARAGAILTEPPSTDVVELRSWMLAEIRRQVDGGEPVPFGASMRP